MKLDFAKADPNLNFADLSFGFAPPKGVGLAVQGDVVNGGGFLLLDPDQGRYAGVLHVELGGGVVLKAIALLDTHLPGDALQAGPSARQRRKTGVQREDAPAGNARGAGAHPPTRAPAARRR